MFISLQISLVRQGLLQRGHLKFCEIASPVASSVHTSFAVPRYPSSPDFETILEQQQRSLRAPPPRSLRGHGGGRVRGGRGRSRKRRVTNPPGSALHGARCLAPCSLGGFHAVESSFREPSLSLLLRRSIGLWTNYKHRFSASAPLVIAHRPSPKAHTHSRLVMSATLLPWDRPAHPP